MRCNRRGVSGNISFVDADMEARLLKLLFYVDLAFLHEGQKVGTKPGDLGEGETMLGDVDGLPCEMRRSSVPFCRSRIAINVHEMLLEFNRPNCGVYL